MAETNNENNPHKHPITRYANEFLTQFVVNSGGGSEVLHLLESSSDPQLRDQCIETFKKLQNTLPQNISELEIIALAHSLIVAGFLAKEQHIQNLETAIAKFQKVNGCSCSDCDLSMFGELGLLVSEQPEQEKGDTEEGETDHANN